MSKLVLLHYALCNDTKCRGSLSFARVALVWASAARGEEMREGVDTAPHLPFHRCLRELIGIGC